MIFDEELKSKYPFAARFFELALTGEQNRFAHGFILSGNDIISQYRIVLDIARYLNCTTSKTSDCNCVNCSWIDQNAHPAVITISPMDFTEKERKKISVEQIRALRNNLGVTSPYHRVIIITDAEESKCDLPFSPPRVPEGKERAWCPKPLSQAVFEKAPCNAMLKILEEPPEHVTFFFLTKNKNDLLPTIVSRCQNIGISTFEEEEDLSIVEGFFVDFPYRNEETALLFANKFLALSEDISPDKILDLMQKFVKKLIAQNAEDRVFVAKSIELLQKFEDAKIKLKSFVKLQNVIESLFLKLR